MGKAVLGLFAIENSLSLDSSLNVSLGVTACC